MRYCTEGIQFRSMFLYACTIFVSAFLLFQVQPIIAKIILPWFGGTAAVWTTCMLFFQTALLGGYLYSHWTTNKLASRGQTTLHIVLMALSLAVLPIVPGDAWKPAGFENPTFRILALLAGTVGIPYLLLSTTGPLIQAWYARAFPDASPYRLFALSNIGSMLGLLGYPTLVEPLLPTRVQANIWSGAYALFVALCALCAWKSRDLKSTTLESASDEVAVAPPGLGMWVLWAGLAACASVLLLAVTTHLTSDVAPIPFLWVLPLSLYLLSFILTFDSKGWYSRLWYLPLVAAALAAMTWALRADMEIRIRSKVAVFACGLFFCCMACHGELATWKPHPRYLTGFYLMISVGGALGGLFVGILAPYVFNQYIELEIGMVLCALLVMLSHYRDRQSPLQQTQGGWGWVLAAGGTLILIVVLGRMVHENSRGYRVIARNFYGELRTADYGTPDESDWSRKLTHGVINHGEQYLHPARAREATSYFGPTTGVARAIFAKDRAKPQRIGITGLGAGVMITYARAIDYIRIYEINPLVIDVAKTEFTFIKDCPGKIDIVLGDARLSLEREQPNNFDILHMDAFSSDSVPVHLLTKEAFELYFRHLKPDGILVMHISNRYLNLEPVVALAAQAVGKAAVYVADPGDDDLAYYATDMVLVGSREALSKGDLKSFAQPQMSDKVRLWTDDYSNLFRIIR
ncbi:MAG: fused MFS/spermidine synthase [Acidobacteria bacterium]|nr:fused MFS/spermidine synthase [Acidobacteriota bacterium]